MALSNVTFTKGSGGLNRRSTSEDGISGLLYYGTKPGGFGTDDVKQIFSVPEAEGFGITDIVLPVLHYHLVEFFRINPNGSIYVGIYPDPVGAHTFDELTDMANIADGRIRQVGVYTQDAFVSSQVQTLQAIVAALDTEHKPLSAIYVADITGITLTALPDLTALTSPKVSVLIGQDAGNDGDALYTSEGKTIGALGAVMGALSKASVQESIAWVGKYNLASAELDVLGLGEGSTNRSLTTTQLTELDTKGYLFLQKHIGIGGSYLNGSWTCSTGDYDTIEKNRAIDKAIRQIRAALLPSLSAPLYVDGASGKLAEDTVQAFQATANRPIEAMAINGELSAAKAFVNPDQDVLATNELAVVAELVPVGVARLIRVTIGFVTKLS